MWYTAAITERDRPPDKLLRAFILYAALADWMDDCQIVIAGANLIHDTEQSNLYRQNYTAACWKACILRQYIQLRLSELARIS